MIGGTLNYARLSQQHRPTDHAQLAAEIRRLASDQNLTPIDISVALRIELAMVRELLVGAA
jgi:hypothetical protein